MKNTKNRILLQIIASVVFSFAINEIAIAQNEIVVSNVGDLVKAVNKGNSGDFIMIKAGVYVLNGSQQLVPKTGMTIVGAGIGLTTFKAASDWDPGIKGLPANEVDETKVNTSPYFFRLEDVSDVKILNMTLIGSTIHGAIYADDCQNLEFFNLKIQDFIWSSILTFDVTGFKIHDCHFHDPGGNVKWMGAAIFSNRTINGEYYHNKITTSPDNINRFVGFKARGSQHCRIHHNTLNQSFKGFAVEYMHADQHYIEIDHNHFNGTVSLPGYNNEHTEEPGFYSFWIHHNYLSKSYALEGARSFIILENNYFDFPMSDDGGRLYTEYATSGTEESIYITNNQIRNPGRGIMWSRGGLYKEVYIMNNHVKANPTITPRRLGLFHFMEECDFSTITIKNNIIECYDISRPLLSNEASAQAVIENNKLVNVSDTIRYENKQWTAVQGLINPLHFTCGYKNEYKVDGWKIIYKGVEN